MSLGPTRADPRRGSPALKSLGPIVATAIVVLFLFVSAIPLLHWFAEEGELSRLSENRTNWREIGIESYRLDLDYRPRGGRPAVQAEFVIRDNRVVAAEASVPESGSPDASTVPARTIDELFDLVEAAIRSTPDELQVSYDQDYRFPRSIEMYPDSGNDHDGYRLAVTRFDPRQTEPGSLQDNESRAP